MKTTVSIAEAKNRLPALVHEAETRPVVIERRGKRVAVLVSAREWDRLTRTSVDWLPALDRFRKSHDLQALDVAGAFEGTRDRSVGRSVRW